MEIVYSSRFKESYKKITKNNLKLANKIEFKISLFINNPYHPSLKTHKVTTTKTGVGFSFWIEGDIRIIFIRIEKNKVQFTLIGSHKEIYK